MFLGKEDIIIALRKLGRRLALLDTEPVTLVICGASALNCAGLLARPTRDVDVLGVARGDRDLKLTGSGLPDELLRPIAEVAPALGAEVDWLNDRALILQSTPGLPPQFETRLSVPPLEFGPCLHVVLPSRQDLVALKFYASLDARLEEGLRHFRDLVELEPTHGEIKFAVAWLLNRPTSAVFRKKVREVAARLGFDKLATPSTAATRVQSQRKRTSPAGKKRRARFSL